MVIFDIGQPRGLYFGGFFLFKIPEVGRDMKFLLGSQNQIHAFDMPHFFRFQLRITPHHNNHCFRIFFHRPANNISALLVALVGYRAGIDNIHICFFRKVHPFEPHFFERSCNGRGFREIEFTPQRKKSSFFPFVIHSF